MTDPDALSPPTLSAAAECAAESARDAVPWDALPSEEDAVALTRQNPKGRLWELCARAKCARPKIHLVRRGSLHGAALRVHIAGRELDSGMQWAWERRLAEQMAARVLLAALAESEDASEPDEWVSAEEEARLRRENPKGALLERCIVLRVAPPVLDVHPIVGADGVPSFEASAHVVLPDGEEVWGLLRRARNAKAAEHAAAASLLAQLAGDVVALPASPAPMPDVGTVAGEPRSILNELRQRGRLRDYGFTLERIDGPPHAPVFRMHGFAVRANGERIEAHGITATSKKEGERLVALRLVEQL